MKTAHKIRINPTPEQVEYLKRACGTRRFIYNWGREQWEHQYQAYKYEVTKCVVEGAFDDLGRAYANFFAGRAEYPRYKKKGKSHESFYLSNDKFTRGRHGTALPRLGRFVRDQRQTRDAIEAS